MPHSFYLFLHIAGIVLVTIAIGGELAVRSSMELQSKKMFAVLHGLGLVLLLVAGFGLIARLGVAWPFPIWVWIKLALWLLIGGFPTYSKRFDHTVSWYLAIGLFLAAAYVGIFKPFYSVLPL